jgi:hypothetical protein
MKLVWYDANAENPAWIKALADVRHMGTIAPMMIGRTGDGTIDTIGTDRPSKYGAGSLSRNWELTRQAHPRYDLLGHLKEQEPPLISTQRRLFCRFR